MKYIQLSLKKLKEAPEGSEKEPTLLQKFLSSDSDPHFATVMVLDMLNAGIDTTSHSLSFFLYNLSVNQDKQEILYQEIKKVIPDDGAAITAEMLNQLQYLRSSMKESMRLLPVTLGNARILSTDVVLSGYRVPKGVLITSAGAIISRREDLYPEPDRFLPERWLTRTETGKKSTIPPPPNFATLPFSYGPRMCIGRRFAELELQLAVIKILQKFRLEYHYGEIGMKTQFVNAPDKPLKFRFIERSN